MATNSTNVSPSSRATFQGHTNTSVGKVKKSTRKHKVRTKKAFLIRSSTVQQESTPKTNEEDDGLDGKNYIRAQLISEEKPEMEANY